MADQLFKTNSFLVCVFGTMTSIYIGLQNLPDAKFLFAVNNKDTSTASMENALVLLLRTVNRYLSKRSALTSLYSVLM